jgi:hypothetical protein
MYPVKFPRLSHHHQVKTFRDVVFVQFVVFVVMYKFNVFASFGFAIRNMFSIKSRNNQHPRQLLAISLIRILSTASQGYPADLDTEMKATKKREKLRDREKKWESLINLISISAS